MANNVKLLKLLHLKAFKEKEEMIWIRKLLEYVLNGINEYSAGLFLRHFHGNAVADLFEGNSLYGANVSLPIIHERVGK